MSKPILGRGLGDLLGAPRATGQPEALARKADAGLRILIDGAPRPDQNALRPAGGTKEPAATAATTLRAADSAAVRAVAVLALISADAALLGWTARFVFTHPHAVGVVPAAGCAFSMLVAALCGCAAVLLRQPQK